jgi:hypothetical protein
MKKKILRKLVQECLQGNLAGVNTEIRRIPPANWADNLPGLSHSLGCDSSAGCGILLLILQFRPGSRKSIS